MSKKDLRINYKNGGAEVYSENIKKIKAIGLSGIFDFISAGIYLLAFLFFFSTGFYALVSADNPNFSSVIYELADSLGIIVAIPFLIVAAACLVLFILFLVFGFTSRNARFVTLSTQRRGRVIAITIIEALIALFYSFSIYLLNIENSIYALAIVLFFTLPSIVTKIIGTLKIKATKKEIEQEEKESMNRKIDNVSYKAAELDRLFYLREKNIISASEYATLREEVLNKYSGK